MMSFDFSCDEFYIAYQSFLTRRDFIRRMIKGVSHKTSYYKMYAKELKQIDALILKFENYE